MLKKFFLSAFVIVVFTLYAIRLNFGDDDNPKVVMNTGPSNYPTAVPTDTPVATLGPTPMPSKIPTSVPVATPQGKYKNGTYTGNVADAFYGNIQVQAVISGGKITDVIFLQYPNDRGTSIEINTQAMPMLKQEAITAQSAKVDGVSGATATSQAFIKSLSSALQQAS